MKVPKYIYEKILEEKTENKDSSFNLKNQWKEAITKSLKGEEREKVIIP